MVLLSTFLLHAGMLCYVMGELVKETNVHPWHVTKKHVSRSKLALLWILVNVCVKRTLTFTSHPCLGTESSFLNLLR